MRFPSQAMPEDEFWFDDPEDEAPIPLSDDSFLYLRAGIVANGKAVVERVLADPAVLLTRRWDDGEALTQLTSHLGRRPTGPGQDR
ncbi:DUF4240 domain-containing protein [Actinoplanes sp. NPDC051346]|uniref:DUF4240 domain-containing protein n=1 Tax=Actinoplanes sp. NPDC051346 TaxID=3155048 RepID=UPI00342A5254